MNTLGSSLKEARTKKGLTIEATSDKTKIRAFYIEKLEENDLKDLPQEVYTRGFIRNLARLYETDEGPLLAFYEKLKNPPADLGQDEDQPSHKPAAREAAPAQAAAAQPAPKAAPSKKPRPNGGGKKKKSGDKRIKKVKKSPAPTARAEKKAPSSSGTPPLGQAARGASIGQLEEKSPADIRPDKALKNKRLGEKNKGGRKLLVGLLLLALLLFFIYLGAVYGPAAKDPAGQGSLAGDDASDIEEPVSGQDDGEDQAEGPDQEGQAPDQPGEESDPAGPTDPADPTDPTDPDAYEYSYQSPQTYEDGLDIMLHLTGDGQRCWISVRVDGQEVVRETYRSGDRLRFYGQSSISLTLGNAGMVDIYADGKKTDFTAQEGEVVYKDFVKE